MNASHYKINSLIKHKQQNRHLARTYQAVPLHIITYRNQTLQTGQIGVLILNPIGRKEAFWVFSWRSYCQRAFTLLCSYYAGQSNAAWGCPVTSIYKRRVVYMEFYFRTSPTPWIPAKSSTFYPLQNAHTALWPTSLLFNGHRGPVAGDKAIGTSIRPLTLSKSTVNNEWN